MADTSSGMRCAKLAFCIAASALIFGVLPAQSQSTVVKRSPTDGVRWGAYDPYGTFANDPNISIEHVFMPWQDADLPSLKLADQYANLRNRSLLITIEPWSWSRKNKPVAASDLHAGIIAGRYDQSIRAFCEMSGSLKSEVTIRWAHEMDLGNKRYPWSQWTPDQYIAAYRHFVQVCRTVAGKAKFMWSPRGEANLRSYYPGDDYVDSIGLSLFGYQKYEISVYGKALSLTERLTPSYQLVAPYDKDIYITEYGCHGDQAYLKRCIEEVKSSASVFPKLVGVIYYNEVETFQWPGPFGSPDWRILSKLAAKDGR